MTRGRGQPAGLAQRSHSTPSTGSTRAAPPWRRVRLWACAGVAVAVIAAGGVAAWGATQLAPVAPSPSAVVEVDIPAGAGTAAIADLLHGRGLIRSPRAFRLLARWLGLDGRLQVGEYALSADMTPRAILDRLAHGRVITVSFTVPEGYTVRRLASLLAERGLADAAAFLAVAKDASFLPPSAFAAGGAAADVMFPLEGYLFPDTYVVPRRAGPEGIARAMTARFEQVLAPYTARMAELKLTLPQVLTLAAIVEKEARVPAERATISAVFHNRLKRGMALEACPTVKYALDIADDVPSVALTYAELDFDSPYNTYRNPGLPPGPICNPGEAAIRAALYPEASDYLFFVAKPDGSHAFSRTYAEHLAQVRRWQGQ